MSARGRDACVRTLGLVLAAVLLAGCAARPPGQTVIIDPPPNVPDTAREFFANFSGELVATPLQPAKAEHPIEVAASVVGLRAILTWSLPTDDITLQLLDPKGKEQGKAVKSGDASATVTIADAPRSGTWKVVVSSSRAVKDAYAVTVALSDPIPGQKTVKDALTLDAGGFAEVNFVMEGKETVAYEWSLRDASGSAEFNVHSHEQGVVLIHAHSTGATGASNFTTPHKEIYSLLWENKGSAPTAVEYRMVGPFRLHSQTARAPT